MGDKPFAKCPVCNKRYVSARITPLGEDDHHSMMHISCPSCGVSSFLSVSANQWGVASIGVLTDLEGEEVKSHFGRETVSTDEALDAYVFFKQEGRRASKWFAD